LKQFKRWQNIAGPPTLVEADQGACAFLIGRGRKMDNQKQFDMNDVVEMKKPHPCGENRWKIIRLGMDIRIKCLGCDHSVLIPRREFTRKIKKILIKHHE
jgi:hypothetical protein